MSAQELSLATPSGASLMVRRWHGARAVAVVHFLHDLGEHSGRYASFGEDLARRGIVACAADLRGHGGTRAPGASRGHFGGGGIAAIHADMFELHEKIAEDHPGLPLMLLGQGAGALIALDYAFAHAPRLAGLALWNMPLAEPFARTFLRAALRWERFRLGSDVPSPTMRRLTLEAWDRRAGTPFGWVSSRPDAVASYLDDPYCGVEPTVGTWLEAVELMRRAASRRYLAMLPRDLPLHVATGGRDPATAGASPLAEWLGAQGFSNLVSRTWPEERHDLANGVASTKIREDFADWVISIART